MARLPSELGVRPGSVVVELPPSESGPGLGQAGEQRLVQQFIPKAPVEAFDEAILHRFAGRDVVPLDTDKLGEGIAIWFGCDDADALHDHLIEQGVPILFAPKDGPFGRYFALRDPFGYAITAYTVAPS